MKARTLISHGLTAVAGGALDLAAALRGAEQRRSTIQGDYLLDLDMLERLTYSRELENMR